MSNPWDVRPPSLRGDSEPNLLFSEIGRALTEWSHIEMTCAKIYAFLVQAKGRNVFQTPPLRAYGSLPSFSTQCQLIRFAGEAFFHKRPTKTHLHNRLIKLLNLVLDYSPRRNEIAHGQVSEVYVQTSKRSHEMKRVGYFLLPAFSQTKKFSLPKGEITYQYHSSDVIYYRQEFTKLHLQLSGFHRDLKG